MVIDIIFALVVLYGFYLGFSRGIISTVFTILSFTFGLMAAFKFAPGMTLFLERSFNSSSPLMFLAGFLLSFAVTMIILRMIARGLEGILKTANINVINQMAGGLLLSGILVLFYSFLLWFADSGHLLDQKTKTESFTYIYLEQFPGEVRTIGAQVQPVFQEFWDQSMNMMDRLERMSIEQTEKINIEDRSNELSSEDSANWQLRLLYL